jgi:transposase
MKIDQIGVPVDEIIADGAYSINGIERLVQSKWPHQKPKLVIPPEKNAVISDRDNPTARDEHLLFIENNSRHRWQEETGYNRRSKVENTFCRYKTILGNTLHSRKFENQEIENQIGCMILNKFKSLGMPDSVKVN